MLWPVLWSLAPLFFSCRFYKGKAPVFILGNWNQKLFFFFFPPVTASTALMYRSGILFIQQVISSFKSWSFSSLNTDVVPRVLHQWFKHGCQINERKCTDLKKTLELLEQRKSTDCSEFRPQTQKSWVLSVAVLHFARGKVWNDFHAVSVWAERNKDWWVRQSALWPPWH